MSSKKFEGFIIASLAGMIAFIFLVLRMPPAELATLCQFYFLYQGLVSGGFFGFRSFEQWANSKYVNEKPEIKSQTELV